MEKGRDVARAEILFVICEVNMRVLLTVYKAFSYDYVSSS